MWSAGAYAECTECDCAFGGNFDGTIHQLAVELDGFAAACGQGGDHALGALVLACGWQVAALDGIDLGRMDRCLGGKAKVYLVVGLIVQAGFVLDVE